MLLPKKLPATTNPLPPHPFFLHPTITFFNLLLHPSTTLTPWIFQTSNIVEPAWEQPLLQLHALAVHFIRHHQEFAQEIQAAVDMLQSLEWEEIRKEKFSITPIAIFESFVRLAESMISREAAEQQRRQQWLAEAAEETSEQDEAAIPLRSNTADKYGVDLEEFKMKTGKKPLHWQHHSA